MSQLKFLSFKQETSRELTQNAINSDVHHFHLPVIFFENQKLLLDERPVVISVMMIVSVSTSLMSHIEINSLASL
jgi:hypothetical protein